MGRQESPQLIDRKGQVDADAQETSRASKYCRQVISIPVSLCFKKCADCAKARAKIAFRKRCLKEDIYHKYIDLDLLLEHQRRKVSTDLKILSNGARCDPSF